MGITFPPGISRRKHKTKESLVITFMFKGVQCRETIRNANVDANGIKYALKLKSAIEHAINVGIFEYDKYFPNSKTKTALQFGKKGSRQLLRDFMLQIKWENEAPKRTTSHTYRKDSRYSIDELGSFRLCDIKASDIRQWIKSMSNLKRKTISNRLTPLRMALALAVADDLIKDNPASEISLSKTSKGLISREQRTSNDKIDPFTLTEIDKILKAAKEYSNQAANYFKLAFYSGLRPSEIMGLKWNDKYGNQNIDFINKTININEVLVVTGGIAFTQDPKTYDSNRTVPLTKKAYDALKDQKSITFDNSDYVFTRLDGKEGHLSHNDHYYKPWSIILKNAGVRYRAPKQTRHTFASQLLTANENIYRVAELMGHTDPSMLFRTYGKWVKNNNRSSHTFTSDFGM